MTVAQAQKAQTLVAAKGRTVTFVKLDRTQDDPAKPWRGTSDPRTTPAATADVPAVIVPPRGVTFLGLSQTSTELLKRAEQIIIAAPGPNSTDELETFDEVIDGSKTWKIISTEVLRHDDGPRILYYVGVRS